MQPIRQIVSDMPALYPVPPEVQHRRVEIILWPLTQDDAQTMPVATSELPRGSARRALELLAQPRFNYRPPASAAEVEARIRELREDRDGLS
ncbi:MAG: hypothetical protein Q8O33_02710 [Pseudomonadota bacterium]|nr:hypothetical protein [Pseudomonadota bacterium]